MELYVIPPYVFMVWLIEHRDRFTLALDCLFSKSHSVCGNLSIYYDAVIYAV
jgi:hypothetical protein